MKQIIEEYIKRIDISKTIVLIASCVSFLFTNYALVYIEVPERNTSIFHAFVGIIEAGFVGVLGYYFGSSKSSAEKTKLLDKAITKDDTI